MITRKVFLVIMAVLLCIPSLIGGQPPAYADEFEYNDVAKGSYAYNEIHYLYEKRIQTGDASGNFRPNESLTRAQAAVIMTNALGIGGSVSGQTFSDVRPDHWAYSAIERAARAGIFRGNNGRFSPSDPISKAHVAIILTRAFNLTGTQTSHFSDVSADFYAVREISALERNGIVERASRFQPNQSATRAQFAAYVARSFEPSFRLDVTEQSVLYQGKVANTSTPLNVRSQPNMDGDVLARLTVGTTVDILGEVGNWFEIKHGNGVAYVHKNYIQKIGSSTSPSDDRKVMEEGRVIANSLNVRQGPSASTETIGRLSFGTIVDIYDYSGNWALIKFNGQWAYTHKDYLVTRKPGEGSGLGNLVIAIDPGHGGKDPGAVGNGLREKDVVLGAGLELNKRLKDLGASTVMTRNNDTFLELSQRAKIANDAKADLFISIHANAAASASATGTETYWNNSHSSEESKALAEAINKRLVEDLGMRDRGAKQANFVVIRETKMPSVLIELGFITNSRDAAVMKRSDFNEVVAKAVIKGIEDFYNW